MLNLTEATAKIKAAYPNGQIQATVPWKNLFLFQIFFPIPGEIGFDPFYSVDRDTGEAREFSIFRDGNPDEITALFMKVKEGG